MAANIMDDLYSTEQPASASGQPVAIQPRKRRSQNIGQMILDVIASLGGKKTSKDYERENRLSKIEGESKRVENEYRQAITNKAKADAALEREKVAGLQKYNEWMSKNEDPAEMPMSLLQYAPY